jgi:hypothetical protein
MSKQDTSSITIPLILTAVWHPEGLKSGRKLRCTELGEFSDADAAALFMLENNPTASFPWLFCYRLKPSQDYRGNGNPVTVFDRNGNLVGGYDNENLDCFPGLGLVCLSGFPCLKYCFCNNKMPASPHTIRPSGLFCLSGSPMGGGWEALP